MVLKVFILEVTPEKMGVAANGIPLHMRTLFAKLQNIDSYITNNFVFEYSSSDPIETIMDEKTAKLFHETQKLEGLFEVSLMSNVTRYHEKFITVFHILRIWRVGA